MHDKKKLNLDSLKKKTALMYIVIKTLPKHTKIDWLFIQHIFIETISYIILLCRLTTKSMICLQSNAYHYYPISLCKMSIELQPHSNGPFPKGLNVLRSY